MNTTDTNDMLLSDEILMSQLRTAIKDNETISSLSDDQMWSILDTWDNYVESIMIEAGDDPDIDDSDVVEIDPDDFYSFLTAELEAEDDTSISLSEDDTIEIINAWLKITDPDNESEEDE